MAQSQSQSLKAKSAERLAAEEMRWRLRENQTTKHFGFALVLAERGKVVLRMRVGKKHLQVHGVVHGGVLAALADTAGGLATYMAAPRGTRVATIEMKINYLEAVSPRKRSWCELDGTLPWWIVISPTMRTGW
jgi:acyl-coenzyme A thioesterase PaaI-like protein